jgi:hypothetical protein
MRPWKFTWIHLGAGALDAPQLGTKLHLNNLEDGAGDGLAPVDSEHAASRGNMVMSPGGHSLVDQQAAYMVPENTAARTHAPESSFIEPISSRFLDNFSTQDIFR